MAASFHKIQKRPRHFIRFNVSVTVSKALFKWFSHGAQFWGFELCQAEVAKYVVLPQQGVDFEGFWI